MEAVEGAVVVTSKVGEKERLIEGLEGTMDVDISAERQVGFIDEKVVAVEGTLVVENVGAENGGKEGISVCDNINVG